MLLNLRSWLTMPINSNLSFHINAVIIIKNLFDGKILLLLQHLFNLRFSSFLSFSSLKLFDPSFSFLMAPSQIPSFFQTSKAETIWWRSFSVYLRCLLHRERKRGYISFFNRRHSLNNGHHLFTILVFFQISKRIIRTRSTILDAYITWLDRV